MTERVDFPWGLGIDAPPAQLQSDGRVLDEDGTCLCTLALKATLYFPEGERDEAREAVVRAYERYGQQTGNALKWGMDPDTGQPEPASAVGDVRAWPPHALQRFDVQLVFHGGADIDDVDPHTFVAVARELEDDELSYVSFSMPLSWGDGRKPADFVHWVTQVCDELGPVHGFGGLAVVSHVAGMDDASSAAVFDLARRFRGLEVDEPAQHAPFLAQEGAIKGVNWLTILGEAHVHQLGGAQHLKQQLGPPVATHAFGMQPGALGSGLIVQAGPAPNFGDNQAREPMPNYHRVYTQLEPVCATNPAVIWPQRAPGFDFAESKAWLHRFATP